MANPGAVSLDDAMDEMDAYLDGLSDDNNRHVSNSQPRPFKSTGTNAMDDILKTVKVKKARAQAPKLDELRLLSEQGIPKLQEIAKSKLKFRGKGHEFSDIAWLLGTYQVWLHDLYPRAKFEDGLALVEKVGHTQAMKKLRKRWIDMSKRPDDSENVQFHDDGNEAMDTDDVPNEAPTAIPEPQQSEQTIDADELDTLLAEDADQQQQKQTITKLPISKEIWADDGDEMDEEEDIMRELGL